MNDFNRNIFGGRRLFTDSKPTLGDTLKAYGLAIAIGLGLCAMLLHSLDAFFY